MTRPPRQAESNRHVVVVGLGNIGSHLVPALTRLHLRWLTLIDPDEYEERNLASQNILRRDVGRPKVRVQECIATAIDHNVAVTTFQAPVESVPLGKLKADVLVACLDSRIARQHVNQSAWRLAIPWIDTGVDGREWLARINAYLPGAEAPCLECAWDENDYAALEQRYPCQGKRTDASAPTAAPASLGAAAASLAAVECEKLLRGKPDESLCGRQVLLDVAHHRHQVTAFRRNPGCRFDHQSWYIGRYENPAGSTRLKDFLEHVVPEDEWQDAVLELEGHRFAMQVACPACSSRVEATYIADRLPDSLRLCTECGAEQRPSGAHLFGQLPLGLLSADQLRRSLRRFGIRDGDVVTLQTPEETLHVEIGPS